MRKKASRTTTDTLSKELADAKKKFEEIDGWEMEFDSASIGAGGGSSPWR